MTDINTEPAGGKAPDRPTLTRIQRLLKADAENAEASPQLIRLLHPWAVDAFDQTDHMFNRLIRTLEDWPIERRVRDHLSTVATDAGLSDDELAARITGGQLADIPGAEAGVAHLMTLRGQKQLVLACQRYWAWGASDLLRLRITSAIGYLRLEAECVGLIDLSSSNHAIFNQWWESRTQAEGRRFFNEHQPALKAALRTRDLGAVYDIASNTSLHVRPAGLVRALGGEGGAIALPDQEFDPDDPYSFHLAVAHYHRVQVRILYSLGQLIGSDGTDWRNAIARFAADSDQMWQALEHRYRAEIEGAAATE